MMMMIIGLVDGPSHTHNNSIVFSLKEKEKPNTTSQPKTQWVVIEVKIAILKKIFGQFF